jgi:hypothetical protein
MKTFAKITAMLALVAAMLVPQAFAQGSYTRTTLGADVGNAAATTINVASSTGLGPITDPITGNGTVNQVGLIEREMVEILAAPTATTIRVRRGIGGTAAAAHKNGSLVFVGPPSYFGQARKYGTCVASNEAVLPAFVRVPNGDVELYNCNNGAWVKQTMPSDVDTAAVPTQYCSVPVGSVAYASFGTDAAVGADELFLVNVHVPVSGVFTGIKALNGSALNGTTKSIHYLFRTDGDKVLASSSTAGTVRSGNDAFQSLAFTATAFITGPANYWIGVNTDSTDANALRTVAASTFGDLLAVKRTSVTFGAATTASEPTTFAADTGPIACLYR